MPLLMSRVAPRTVAVYGRPESAVKVAVNRQFPRIAAATPPFSSQRRPGPNGSSAPRFRVSRFRRSKFESPHSASMSRSSWATLLLAEPPPIDGELSRDLASVYSAEYPTPRVWRFSRRKVAELSTDWPSDDYHMKGCTPSMRSPLASRLGARTTSRLEPTV